MLSSALLGFYICQSIIIIIIIINFFFVVIIQHFKILQIVFSDSDYEFW